MNYEVSKILMTISQQIDTILILNVSYDPVFEECYTAGAPWAVNGSLTASTNHQE